MESVKSRSWLDLQWKEQPKLQAQPYVYAPARWLTNNACKNTWSLQNAYRALLLCRSDLVSSQIACCVPLFLKHVAF
jgi:hypothetical protein